MGIFSDVQGQLTPQPVVRGGRNSNSSELSCMLSLSASGDTVFSIINLWELSVAMETRVLIRSGLKPNAANPPPK